MGLPVALRFVCIPVVLVGVVLESSRAHDETVMNAAATRAARTGVRAETRTLAGYRFSSRRWLASVG
jgi:hypothetical protein